MSLNDEKWMRHALKQANDAGSNGEVPVGAVIVLNDQLIAEAGNQQLKANDPTAHAEIQAIRLAAEKIGNYRLVKSKLYVTLEPCLMCFGAMINARIEHLIYGANDKRFGVIDALDQQKIKFNHKLAIKSGVLEHECATLLQDFFKQKRNQN